MSAVMNTIGDVFEVGSMLFGNEQAPPPKPKTPAWVLPVSIGGGVLVIVLIIWLFTRGKPGN